MVPLEWSHHDGTPVQQGPVSWCCCHYVWAMLLDMVLYQGSRHGRQSHRLGMLLKKPSCLTAT